jgi:beta-lactamase regulating signal transducer with metallopeptidase domain
MSLTTSIETAWQLAALMLVQSTLLIAGVYLTVKLLRLRDAALLSVIYRSVLLATLVAPLGTLTMTRSEIAGWWPRHWSERPIASLQPVQEQTLQLEKSESTLNFKVSSVPLTPQSTMESVLQTTPPKDVQSSEAASASVAYPDLAFTAKCVFCFAWLSISILFLIRLWRTHLQLARTLSKAVPVEQSVQSYCDQLAGKFKVSSPRVVCSPYFTSPFLTGVLHPIVHLSSDGTDDLDHDRANGLRDILIHELAHLKRRDVLMRMLSHCVLSIFFFQPLLWSLIRWLENNAADVCDDYAVSFGARRDHYAGRLVDLAERCDFPLGSAVGIASGRSMLSHRVARIMDGSRKLSTRVSRRIRTVCGLVTAAAITSVCLMLTPSGVAVARAAQQPSVDIDDAFEKLTAVENAVHTEQREGLIYTIHQAKRFENGGVLIMSSVRGTGETLQKYPLSQGNYNGGPAKNWVPSPQGAEHFRLVLADANHLGVDVQWWIMVPRGRLPNWFEDKDGRVRLELGITPQGEYAKANHADERGVIGQFNWTLPLNVPKPEQLPLLDDIVASVHSDLTKLKASIFARKLNMGVKYVRLTPTSQFGSPDEVSSEEFVKATREHWEWWERGDVDFQIKSGGTGYRIEIGGMGMRPAVMVDYLSVVDDNTLARATERSDLVVISARGTKITDAGLAYLKGLTTLKSLDVANTAITDDGLRHLETMKSLERLNVTGTGVTQAGIQQLRKSLTSLVFVTHDDDTHTNPSDLESPDNDSQPLPSKVSGIVTDSADQPVVGAQVTVLIRTFATDLHEELKGSRVWTAKTDSNGQYSIAPTGTVRASNEVCIRVVAEGFADAWGRDYEKKILEGVLPSVRMPAGRRITGRLVGEDGEGVAEAMVRFQCGNADLTVMWDSGPFPVDQKGRFSLSIPTDGTAVGAIYPTGFAPRFVDVTVEADQGNIVLEKGVALKGRVVDKNGQGVAKTVVGIRKIEHRVMFAFMAVIGTAVRTDESGYFQLPALGGAYKLSVERSVADYSRQMMLDGDMPPAIEPVTFEFNSPKSTTDILLQEQSP